jgi:hypothetical protein
VYQVADGTVPMMTLGMPSAPEALSFSSVLDLPVVLSCLNKRLLRWCAFKLPSS